MISEPCYAVTARSEVLRLRNTLNKKCIRTVVLTQAQYAYNKLLSFIGTLVFLASVPFFVSFFVYPLGKLQRKHERTQATTQGNSNH